MPYSPCVALIQTACLHVSSEPHPAKHCAIVVVAPYHTPVGSPCSSYSCAPVLGNFQRRLGAAQLGAKFRFAVQLARAAGKAASAPGPPTCVLSVPVSLYWV